MSAVLEKVVGAGQSVVGPVAAASLSLLLAETCGIENPIYACLAALIATGGSLPQPRHRPLRHLGAALVGVSCAVIATLIVKPAMWRIEVGILFSLLSCRPMFLRTSSGLAACVSAIVVSTFDSNSWSSTVSSVYAVIFGILSAWIVSVVLRILRLDEAIFSRGPVSNNVILITSHHSTPSLPFVSQRQRRQQ